MAYIIEKANMLKKNQIINSTIIVENDRIAALTGNISHTRFMKMNAENYIMTPSYCLLNMEIPLQSGTFLELKEYITSHFLLRGSTILFTCIHLSYEKDFDQKMREMKTALFESPIDYVIGIKIPLRSLSSSLIRKCKKEKIPAIFLEISDMDEMAMVPWGWMRDALFPYNCPLIPVISSSLKKEAKTVLSKWKCIMEKERISSLLEELEENEPLSFHVLNKIGIYPHKGSLMHGTELSYNLYLDNKEFKNVDEKELFHYHGDRLVVTVHKGCVVRSGKQVLYQPGYGEYVKVKIPSYFSL